MTQVKYIQYLPKKLGYSKYNFDKAIKSLSITFWNNYVDEAEWWTTIHLRIAKNTVHERSIFKIFIYLRR